MKAISGAVIVIGALQILLASKNLTNDALLLLGIGLGIVGLVGWIYGLIAEK
jgi:uncharacterized membrane protein